MIDYKLPFDEYLRINAVSSSELKRMLVSPAEYYWAKKLARKEETPATKLGTAIHAAILEPKKFDETYALETELIENKTKGEGYKAWNAFKKENEGKIILPYEDVQTVRLAQLEASRNPLLQGILSNGVAEVSATSKRYGSSLKARTDFLTLDNSMWDVKTTSEPIRGEADIERIIAKWRYYFQAAFHLAVFADNAVAAKSYGWIFVTTGSTVPYIYIVRASETLIQYGIQAVERCLQTLRNCIKDDHWPGIEQTAIPEISPGIELLERFG